MRAKQQPLDATAVVLRAINASAADMTVRQVAAKVGIRGSHARGILEKLRHRGVIAVFGVDTTGKGVPAKLYGRVAGRKERTKAQLMSLLPAVRHCYGGVFGLL